MTSTPSVSIPIAFEPSPAFYDLVAKIKPSPFIFDVTVDPTIVTKAIHGIQRRMKGQTDSFRMSVADDDTGESIGVINVSGLRVNGNMIWKASNE